MLAHNGEINTLQGNIVHMRARERGFAQADQKALSPVLDPGASDSAMLDNALELLTYSGRSLAHAVTMAIPEAWQKDDTMDPEVRAFYEYHASLMEPWDGPACVAFTDGRVAGAVLDRNGLRPGRYVLTKDGTLILASEAGVIDLAPEQVVARERLRPGRMLLVDLEHGGVVDDGELKRDLAARAPYPRWVSSEMVRVRELSTPLFHTLPQPMPEIELRRAQRVFGYTRDDLTMLLSPMAATGKEPVGAMGDDTPLAVLSEEPELLFHYFKQQFAQVTNPPIDPLREDLVMSLRTTLGPSRSLLEETAEHCEQLELDGPVLTNARLRQIRALRRGGLESRTLKTLFEVKRGPGGLRRAVEMLAKRAENAIADGASILILSDRAHDEDLAPIPSLLAVAAVHQHLIDAGVGQKASLVVETGEAREVMHLSLLLGYGASAVNPYLAYDTIIALTKERLDLDPQTGVEQYIKGLQLGILKVMSKMGISTLQSYRGAQLFEAVGLSDALVEEFFQGTVTRIGGLLLEDVARETLARHGAVQLDRAGPLPTGGHYKWRRDGRRHAYGPSVIGLLQHAARSGDYRQYKRYSRLANSDHPSTSLRSMLELCETAPIPLSEVEPAGAIVERFRTGAMSFGSISKEAHETLAIAMNRLGGRSNSGEGGEDPARFVPDPNGDLRRSAVKQIASGRFGVTPEYLGNARELQIKVAQGAKPGEGGQLPGHKVDQTIATIRCSTPGVGLISPPPHHDIYSIEDLAQLIHDLRAANDRATISVKLVSAAGVGTIAAGVVKAGADHVLISGASGGTGAAPLSSIKHAGLPWELGVAETQQVLVMNDLRGRVVLETDGQLKTGRDVVIGALLGAEAFGFGTAALVALGCVMMRVCHLNTCPVGVATQDPRLRSRFRGEPEHVINFMSFVAEEVREHLARLGARRFEEIVGRVELLRPRPIKARERRKASTVDLGAILHPVRAPRTHARRFQSREEPAGPSTLEADLLVRARPAIEEGAAVTIDCAVQNSDRTVGTRLSAEVVRRRGPLGLSDATIRVRCRGSAGQSFGAFVCPGIELRLRGEANDAVAKGLAGGRVVLVPPEDIDDHVLAGNVALYGATGGELYLRGVAGERFAVRNSGANAVVEGVGAHGCEYMTRGTVLVLGAIGRNFGAGMSGGVAFVLDQPGLDHRINRGLVDLFPLDDFDREEVRRLLRAHKRHTGSVRAEALLATLDAAPDDPDIPLRKVISPAYLELRAKQPAPRLRVVHG
ncbi:MAG: glutamate synthase large subunit, partial [Myxococcota bacterium]